MTAVSVQKSGLGVLWNLCDSDEHWAAFLAEGPSMAAVLLATMQHHPEDRRIEESVIGAHDDRRCYHRCCYHRCSQ